MDCSSPLPPLESLISKEEQRKAMEGVKKHGNLLTEIALAESRHDSDSEAEMQNSKK